MAKLKCELVSIYASKEQSGEILKRLQEMAIMDILTASQDEETAYIPEGYLKASKENSADYLTLSAKADNALKILNERYPQKKGMLSFLSGTRTVEDNEFYLDEEKKTLIGNKIEKIISLEKSIADNKAEIIRNKTEIEQLKPWAQLDIPIGFSGTETCSALIGTLSGNISYNDLTAYLAQRLPDIPIIAEIIFTLKDSTGIFLIFDSEKQDKVETVVRDLGFARPTAYCSVSANDKIDELNEKIKALYNQEKLMLSHIEKLSHYHNEIEVYSDYLSSQAEKADILEKIAVTENTVLIRGYVASEDIKLLKDVLNRSFTLWIESEPANEELSPVKLKNNAFASPAETITRMYSLPSASDIDPTPLTGFFYYLLFGMMLSDAGYGLLMILGTLFALKKFKPSKEMRNTIKLFLYCGISTFLWGAFFGSFFGDSIAVISENFFGKRIALPAIIDPMNGGAVQLLILSLGIGLVQIIAGLCAKFVTSLKNGDKAGAFFDAGLWITTLLGVGILAVGMIGFKPLVKVGAILSISSLIGLILTQGRAHKNIILRLLIGIKSLYDITGYVSDLLSFSRLMALGLTTAAMGAVFNLLGTLAGNGIAGVILMLVIFPVGHAISFALNVLGAYVHTLRLQYVELFSKFYDGGGREFKTFSIKNKYVGIDYGNKEEH